MLIISHGPDTCEMYLSAISSQINLKCLVMWVCVELVVLELTDAVKMGYLLCRIFAPGAAD